jgi:S1-C subfamily serine protease
LATSSWLRVEDYEQFQDELEKHNIGDTVTLTLLRDGGQVDVRVMLEEM